MHKIPWLLPLIGAILGVFAIFASILFATTSTQEMVGYSMACAFAIVPYVFVRSVTELANDRDELRELRRIAELLAKAQNPKP
jgi:hypothetical protein